MKETEDVKSPEFWFQKTMEMFEEEIPDEQYEQSWEHAPSTRRERLDLLYSYLIGNPPLPFISAKYEDIFKMIMRKARVNYALLTVDTIANRNSLSTVTTETDSDFDGDDIVRLIHEFSGFAAVHSDIQTYLYCYGESYGHVLAPVEGLDPSEAPPLIIAEDPRFCVGIEHPLRPNRLRSWVKVWYDAFLDQQVAVFYFEGVMRHARREEGATSNTFAIEEWEWSNEEGETEVTLQGLENFGGVPVVKFKNKLGMGEFEAHIDNLDRIMDQILMRLVIQWYQSFKQRAIKGDLDGGADFTDADDTDTIIRDMRDGGNGAIQNLFEADPGSLWLVPEGVDFWESDQAQFADLQKAILDDIKIYAALTSTPLNILAPDSANQTAGGAELMRESFMDKIKDRRARQTPMLILLHQIALAIGGEESRTARVRIFWARSERESLQVKGDFLQKTKGILSRKRQLINYLEMDPEEVRLNETELTQEIMLAQAMTVDTSQAEAEDEEDAAAAKKAKPAGDESKPAVESEPANG